MKLKLILPFLFLSIAFTSVAQENPFQTKNSQIEIKGKFKVDEFLPSLSFKLVGSDAKFGIEISLSEEGDHKSCLYKVTRLTSPQQTKSIRGVIYARMMKALPCNYHVKDKKLQSILNDTRLINIRYQLEQDNTISGNIELQGLQHREDSTF